jgi:glycine/D-amino acid oxidase-like deaminating enzyme
MRQKNGPGIQKRLPVPFLPLRILIASPCSGHGFKHSAAIGEALAEQIIDGKSKIDIAVST